PPSGITTLFSDYARCPGDRASAPDDLWITPPLPLPGAERGRPHGCPTRVRWPVGDLLYLVAQLPGLLPTGRGSENDGGIRSGAGEIGLGSDGGFGDSRPGADCRRAVLPG